MTVRVNNETMTLQIVDCDPFEGGVLASVDGRTIDVVLVDSTSPEQHEKDLVEAEAHMCAVDKKLAEAVELNKKNSEEAEKNKLKLNITHEY